MASYNFIILNLSTLRQSVLRTCSGRTVSILFVGRCPTYFFLFPLSLPGGLVHFLGSHASRLLQFDCFSSYRSQCDLEHVFDSPAGRLLQIIILYLLTLRRSALRICLVCPASEASALGTGRTVNFYYSFQIGRRAVLLQLHYRSQASSHRFLIIIFSRAVPGLYLGYPSVNFWMLFVQLLF